MEHLGTIAIDQFEWVSATAEDQPEKPALMAGIRCMCQGREVARCHFFRDDIPLTPNWYDGRCIHLMFHWSEHTAISAIFSGKKAICLGDLLARYATGYRAPERERA